jgi:glycosyltransferase involved in cell wall biosynthesis
MPARWLVYTRNPDKPSFRIRFRLLAPLLAARGIALETVVFPKRRRDRTTALEQARSADGAIVAKFLMSGAEIQTLRRAARALVYDVDDAVCYPDDGHTGLLTHLSKRMRRYRAVCGAVDRVHAATPILAQLAQQGGARATTVVRSGTAIHAPASAPAAERLGWVGSRSTRKYLSLLAPVFATLAAQSPPPTLVVIADEPVDAPLPVEFHAWSEETEARVIPSLSLGLAPLPDNAFTRGKAGYKIISLASYGVPSAASPVGEQATLIDSGTSGWLCATDADWLAAISSATGTAPEQRRACGAAALSRVTASHALDVVADVMAESLFAATAAGSPA